jgi:hypothetical protein
MPMADEEHKTDQDIRRYSSITENFRESQDVTKGLGVADLGISTQTALSVTNGNPMAPSLPTSQPAQQSNASAPSTLSTDSNQDK